MWTLQTSGTVTYPILRRPGVPMVIPLVGLPITICLSLLCRPGLPIAICLALRRSELPMAMSSGVPTTISLPITLPKTGILIWVIYELIHCFDISFHRGTSSENFHFSEDCNLSLLLVCGIVTVRLKCYII